MATEKMSTLGSDFLASRRLRCSLLTRDYVATASDQMIVATYAGAEIRAFLVDCAEQLLQPFCAHNDRVRQTQRRRITVPLHFRN